jgi:tight adherence protein B
MLQLVILGGAFLTVVFFCVGFYQMLFASRLTVLERLKVSTLSSAAQQQVEAARAKSLKEEFLRFLGILGTTLSRWINLQTIQQKLLQAHILMRAEEFIGLTICSGIAIFILFYLVTGHLLLALPAGLAGFKMPDLVVGIKKNQRVNTLTQQLPEALTIISNGLRAGYSFPQAMSVVGREMGPPIGEEFSRVIWENRMGKPLEEVLHNLGERTGSEDLNLVITALLIQKQVGGNLAEILDNISHTIRERVRIKGEIKTLTAQGRLSAVIIILLPVGVAAFLMFMNPEYMLTLVQEVLGLIMLGVAVVLQIVGIIVIRKIVNIEV